MGRFASANDRWRDSLEKGPPPLESIEGKPRTIHLNKPLMDLLSGLSSKDAGGYVFPSPKKEENSPITDINHTFRRVCKKAGIENLRFHDLRHTFASHLTIQNVPVKAVQELLGHSSLNVTMKYAHLADLHKEQAVKALEGLFSQRNFAPTANSPQAESEQAVSC
jgi:integrase